MKIYRNQGYISYSCVGTFSLLWLKRKRACAKGYCYTLQLTSGSQASWLPSHITHHLQSLCPLYKLPVYQSTRATINYQNQSPVLFQSLVSRYTSAINLSSNCYLFCYHHMLPPYVTLVLPDVTVVMVTSVM